MRILLTGAGGPAAIGVARSLRGHYLVGADANRYALNFAETNVKYLTPKASEAGYIDRLLDICKNEQIEFVHAQPDAEVAAISATLESFPTFLPEYKTVAICQDKFSTWQAWSARLAVPRTMYIYGPRSVEAAFEELGRPLWIRLRSGAAGAGALKVFDVDEARTWINRHSGWGLFIASEYLPGRCFTYQTLWYHGKMVAGQGRERLDWAMSSRAPSGVTGVTGVARISNDPEVAAIATRAILAVDREPHGIFGVDMKCDARGVPNPTEINIGRFFTTIEFFTQMGLNFPEMYVDLFRTGAIPRNVKRLEEGWCWIRSMDAPPKLVRE